VDVASPSEIDGTIKIDREIFYVHEETSDEILIELIKSCNEQALELLIDKYSLNVTLIIYRHIQRCDGDWRDAEGLTIEVFFSVWERIHAYNPDKGSLRKWINMLAKYTALSFNRRVTMARKSATRVKGGGQKQLKDPMDKVIDRVTAETLLNKLPDEKAQIIHLKFYECKSYQEIAEIIDCPEGTVKSRLYRAIEQLKMFI
jgi:RNA polymerase sigma-70 factor (ECF subfamily)